MAGRGPPAAAFSQSDRLRKFIQPLRGVGGTGIPLAQPDTVTQPWWQPGVTHYTIDIRQFADQLHPDLPNPTRLWGFGQGPTPTFRHLGGIIAVKRGTPVQVTFRNHCPRGTSCPSTGRSWAPRTRTTAPMSTFMVLAACLYGHEPAGDGRAEWGRRQRVARSGMI
jgi:hypothetical protein